MPIVKKAPAILTREVHMEEPVSALLDDYAQFIESSRGSRRQCRASRKPSGGTRTIASGASRADTRPVNRGRQRSGRRSHDAQDSRIARISLPRCWRW